LRFSASPRTPGATRSATAGARHRTSRSRNRRAMSAGPWRHSPPPTIAPASTNGRSRPASWPPNTGSRTSTAPARRVALHRRLSQGRSQAVRGLPRLAHTPRSAHRDRSPTLLLSRNPALSTAPQLGGLGSALGGTRQGETRGVSRALLLFDEGCWRRRVQSFGLRGKQASPADRSGVPLRDPLTGRLPLKLSEGCGQPQRGSALPKDKSDSDATGRTHDRIRRGAEARKSRAALLLFAHCGSVRLTLRTTASRRER